MKCHWNCVHTGYANLMVELQEKGGFKSVSTNQLMEYTNVKETT